MDLYPPPAYNPHQHPSPELEGHHPLQPSPLLGGQPSPYMMQQPQPQVMHSQPQMTQPQSAGQPPVAQPMIVMAPPSSNANQNTNVVVNAGATAGAGAGGAQYKKLRKWTTDLCNCFDDLATCLGVFFCPNLYLCYFSHLYREGCCMPWFVPHALVVLRTKLRAENYINGSICQDCIYATVCYQLTLCQTVREWKIINENIDLGIKQMTGN